MVTVKQEGRRRHEQGFSGARASFPPGIFEYRVRKMSIGDNNGTLGSRPIIDAVGWSTSQLNLSVYRLIA